MGYIFAVIAGIAALRSGASGIASLITFFGTMFAWRVLRVLLFYSVTLQGILVIGAISVVSFANLPADRQNPDELLTRLARSSGLAQERAKATSPQPAGLNITGPQMTRISAPAISTTPLSDGLTSDMAAAINQRHTLDLSLNEWRGAEARLRARRGVPAGLKATITSDGDFAIDGRVVDTLLRHLD
jgi:hypothetical protein